MSTEVISKWVLRVLLAITVVVFALFFLVGFDTPYEEDPKMNNPKMTDVVLVTCIALIVAAIVLTIWSVVKQLTTGGNTTSKDTGLAAHTGLVSIIALVVTVVIGLIVGISNKGEHMLINGENWNIPSEIIITDTCIIPCVALLVITLLVLIGSMFFNVKR